MSYENKTIDGKKCVWLQLVGYVTAKPIEDFKKGDTIAYNWGDSAIIVSVKKATPKFYDVTVKSCQSQKTYTSRVKKGTLKPYYTHKCGVKK